MGTMQVNVATRAATEPFREPTLNWFKSGEHMGNQPLEGEYLPDGKGLWLPFVVLAFGIGLAAAALFMSL